MNIIKWIWDNKWSIIGILALSFVFFLQCSSCGEEFKEKARNWIVEKDSMALPQIDGDNIQFDTIRHYYPVVQGQVLKIAYYIANRSDSTLVIQEIQTSCGCVVPRSELPIIIFPKDTGYVHVDFNSTKNSGYVCHYIDCFGNFKGEEDNSEGAKKVKTVNVFESDSLKQARYIELRFDTNVVPPADYTHDYEEVWHEEAGIDGAIRDFVDGKSSQKGYWLDKDTIKNN